MVNYLVFIDKARPAKFTNRSDKIDKGDSARA
jgi:hypothetical protein